MIFGGQFGLGIGQSWQNVTRLPNVIYTNTSGKPIFFKVVATNSTAAAIAAAFLSILVNSGAITLTMHKQTMAIGDALSSDAIIPNNTTYHFGGAVGLTITYVVELR